MGILRSIDGIVCYLDHKDDPTKTTNFYKLNGKIGVAIFNGADSAIDFCQKYLENQGQTIEEVIKLASKAISDHVNDYKKNPFSFVILHNNAKQSPIFYGVWFDNDGCHAQILTDATLFSDPHKDISMYLTVKSYSDHMSLPELTNLAGYIALQCGKIFNLPYQMNFITISTKEIKEFTDGEAKELLQKCEKRDHELKKICSDFFILNEDMKK